MPEGSDPSTRPDLSAANNPLGWGRGGYWQDRFAFFVNVKTTSRLCDSPATSHGTNSGAHHDWVPAPEFVPRDLLAKNIEIWKIQGWQAGWAGWLAGWAGWAGLSVGTGGGGMASIS